MLESGYIKVYRSLLFWEWYDDANTLRVFLHLLLTANHEEQSWKGIKVQRGQRVSSFSKIGQELGLSEKEVRTAVRHLIKTGEVAHNATSKYGVFTVNNYDRFQMRAPSGEPEREPKWHPEGGQPEGHSGTRRATKEEGKEKKKKKLTAAERKLMIEQLTKEMKAAAKLLEFEHAAFLRDKIKQLEGQK